MRLDNIDFKTLPNDIFGILSVDMNTRITSVVMAEWLAGNVPFAGAVVERLTDMFRQGVRDEGISNKDCVQIKTGEINKTERSYWKGRIKK